MEEARWLFQFSTSGVFEMGLDGSAVDDYGYALKIDDEKW
jgi:hypothetical protein